MPSPVTPGRCSRISLSLLLTIASGAASSAAPVQAGPAVAESVSSQPAHGAPAARSAPNWHSGRGQYYKRNWGVDVVGVKPVASGYMLTFRYRILDPDKAKVLNDRKSRAYLIDAATGTVLMVPTMENVGELRPGATPEADRTYFMIFGNPGKLVKSGSRVSIVAGALRIDGLIVE
jgi:hypothetical protein